MYYGSLLDKASKLTSEIFDNIDKKYYSYDGYELIWSIYNIVHIKYSIPYFENSEVLSKIDDKTLKHKIIYLKKIIQDILLVVYSLLSILYVKIRYEKMIAIWSGDFYSAANKGDFRVGDLYCKLDEKKLAYIDFIRDDANGFINTIKNMFNRKRPVIYYSSIERIYTLFSKSENNVFLKKENALHYNILNKCIADSVQPQKIRLFMRIYKVLNINKFICWEYSDRQATLIHAAKMLHIKTIGFMHGTAMKNYMAHNYISEFNNQKRIGPDVMGVWSNWWYEYYNKNSKLYNKIEVCGMLRKSSAHKEWNISNINKVLWISEPLGDLDELVKYIRYFNDKYELVIKKRPFTNDIFYNKLIKYYPEFKNTPVLNGDIYEAILESDLVVGSHSTAVIDAIKVKKPFLMINTYKWGNYFEVDDNFFISDINQIKDKVKNIDINKLEKLNSKYFGKSEDDGVEWVIDKIKI